MAVVFDFTAGCVRGMLAGKDDPNERVRLAIQFGGYQVEKFIDLNLRTD